MLFNELKKESGMTLTELSNYFEVPYRTIQNWAAGVSQCPTYLMKLFVYKMKQDGILTSDDSEISKKDNVVRITVVVPEDIHQQKDCVLSLYNMLSENSNLYELSFVKNEVTVVCKSDSQDTVLQLLKLFNII